MNVAPDTTCVYSTNQCYNDTQCQLGGDINGKCDTSNTEYCKCSSTGYFNDVQHALQVKIQPMFVCQDKFRETRILSMLTLYIVPLPLKCVGVFEKNYLRILWDKSPYDGDIEYRVIYKSTTGSKQVTTSMAGIFINDFDTNLAKQGGDYGTVDVIMNGIDGNTYTANSSLSCISYTAYPTPGPTTAEPSMGPTTAEPTIAPTPVPSYQPTGTPTTSYPTSERIGYYINGAADFCKVGRCDCFVEAFTCCTSKEYACDTYYKQIEVVPDDDNVSGTGTMKNDVKVRMYPDDYPYESTLCWEIRAISVVNKTIIDIPSDGSSGKQRRRLGSNSG